MKTVDILLSVYGNARFLAEFLHSLQCQDCQDFRLLYRFDGEVAPETERLLKDFSGSAEISGRVHTGIVRSYQELLNASEGEYLMLADQDDVWHPDKISSSLAAIRQMENKKGKSFPILVHSDLQIVDCHGKILSRSFWRFQALDPQKKNLRDLMIQNNITGCTMILNRALARCVTEFPAAAICHDRYLALVAAAFGAIGHISRPLIDYRQHADNVFGAVPRRRFLSAGTGRRRQLHERLALTQHQALSFLLQFREKLSPDQCRILEIWGQELPAQRSYWKRLALARRYGFQKNDWLRTLGMWWAL